MRKMIGYIPAVLFTAYYLCVGLVGSGFALSIVFAWLVCFWLSAFFLHKGAFWGSMFGLIPSVHMIYTGTQYTGQVVSVELPLGIILTLFYAIYGFCLWKKRNVIPKTDNKEIAVMVLKTFLTIAVIMVSSYCAILSALILTAEGINAVISSIAMFFVPSLFLPLIWLKKRKKFFFIWLIPAAIFLIALGVNYGMVQYDKSITINTSPNINVQEYLPFQEDSKIVKYKSNTVKFTENAPVIDGAAALFPVYSAFVHATYPDTTELRGDGPFQYNNTPDGYKLLSEKQTDIFIGVYPSEEQKAYAEACNTTFRYTPIGSEGFVFFVHKDNPIENLTTEQIQGIYSGEITNWSEVGGNDEKIEAFQRNEGSGSQSMLKRFMGDKPIMEAPTELKNDLMAGIIEQVANYKSKTNSIGFSFRFYVEGIIKNPDIKMISIDGVAPAAKNIKNGTYPVVTPIYAVTYEEETNENVEKLLSWILSSEGQHIIEETGYVGIVSDLAK